MIGKQVKGRSFRGLLDYLEGKEKAEIIGGNMSGQDAQELAAEFAVSRQLNYEVERAVYHVSLSLPLHERLDNIIWNEVAAKYMKGMGFTDNQYVVYRHYDQPNDHIHIAASRIKLSDGSCVHDSWDYLRSEKLIRQLEKEYRLEPVANSRDKIIRTASTGQFRRFEREQAEYERGQRDTPPQQPIKTQLQALIDESTTDQPTMPDLVLRLQRRGVEVRCTQTRNGKSQGISYQWQGNRFSGTQLGAAYTFPGLQKHRGVVYEPQQHAEALVSALAYQVETSQQLLSDTYTDISSSQDFDYTNTTDNSDLIEPPNSFDWDNKSQLGLVYNPNVSIKTVDDFEPENNFDWDKELHLWQGYDSKNITKTVDDHLKKNSQPLEPYDSFDIEQQQLLEIVAPIVIELLEFKQTNRLKLKYYTAAIENDLLTLRDNKDNQLLMKAEWNKKNQRWFECGSRLTAEITDYFQSKVKAYLSQAIQKQQERAAMSRPHKSLEPELEL